jgi:3-hydroxy-9,10-secoandrosta-1,3,5(10)-triene-9,17-dione monooxygenase
MSVAKLTDSSATTILQNVVAMQPWLRDHQAAAERERRVPQETIDRLDAAGVFRLTAPAAYGGGRFSMREQFDIFHALSSCSPASTESSKGYL